MILIRWYDGSLHREVPARVLIGGEGIVLDDRMYFTLMERESADCMTCDVSCDWAEGSCGSCDACDACDICDTCDTCDSCDACDSCDSDSCSTDSPCVGCDSCDAEACAVCNWEGGACPTDSSGPGSCEGEGGCAGEQHCPSECTCDAACQVCDSCEGCDLCDSEGCATCDFEGSCYSEGSTLPDGSCEPCDVCDAEGCAVCDYEGSCNNEGSCAPCDVCDTCEACDTCESSCDAENPGIDQCCDPWDYGYICADEGYSTVTACSHAAEITDPLPMCEGKTGNCFYNKAPSQKECTPYDKYIPTGSDCDPYDPRY